jgi:nucleoside-diphosphate-sugar epimerase
MDDYMKVLVIGGNRFFGKKLVHLLSGAGHDVTVANRGSKPKIFSSPVKTIVVDRCDESSMEKAFAGSTWDVVYDQVCNSKMDAEICTRIFTDKTNRLIFASTASVYSAGADRDESFFDAETFNFSDQSENDYQHGKRSAEKVYLGAAFPVVAVRFPVVVGVDDYKKRMHWHIDKIMKKEPIFFPNIEALFSFIRSDEAAAFLFWLLTNDSVQGAINASAQGPVKLRDFVENIGEFCWETMVAAEQADEENHSPYGIQNDSTLSTKKATKFGFEFSKTADWFEDLIEEICDSYNSWQ